MRRPGPVGGLGAGAGRIARWIGGAGTHSPGVRVLSALVRVAAPRVRAEKWRDPIETGRKKTRTIGATGGILQRFDYIRALMLHGQEPPAREGG